MTIAEAWIAIKAIVFIYSYRKHFYVIVIRVVICQNDKSTHFKFSIYILSSVIVKLKKNSELRICREFDYHEIIQAECLCDEKALLKPHLIESPI